MALIKADTTAANNPVEGYDLIGDVHGCARLMVKLIKKMGYRYHNGFFQHPHRKVVFLGDLIDRGPMIRETISVARSMIDNNAAHMVLGNHEYAAITYTTPAPANFDRPYLSRHSRHSQALLEQTLSQYSGHLKEWRNVVEWLRSMPICLEFANFRAVHACWDSAKVELLRQSAANCNLVDDEFLQCSVQVGTDANRIVERLLKGTDMPLPSGQSVQSADGFKRQRFRTKFWQATPQTYGDVVFQPDRIPEKILRMPLSDEDKRRLVYYASDDKPLFVGHYWCKGEPQPLQNNLACLDYGAVKFGRLVGYRMGVDDTSLSADGFIWVDA